MKRTFTARCLLPSLVLLVGFSSNAEAQRQAAPAAAPEVAVMPAQQAAEQAEAEQADTRRPGHVFLDCPTCPEMVVIPAGPFQMGSDPREENSQIAERPQHPVTVEIFALGRYEVTREEYSAFVAATQRTMSGECTALMYNGVDIIVNDSVSWRDPGFGQGGGHPVVCVSWEDAQAYARWLSEQTGQDYRLPSEAEWEYAARAGTTTAYSWGNDIDEICGYANGMDTSMAAAYPVDGLGVDMAAKCSDGAVWTVPVGLYVPNDFGLYDMHGNVWEWVQDCWHESYRRAPSDGTAWTSGGDCSLRVLRGGSWYYNPRYLRSANRDWNTTGNRLNISGFRVARTITP